jgi:2-polyprenyl-3-methyl-5-hydroxy-6-metoxy-1,4-benzoquinol methylase
MSRTQLSDPQTPSSRQELLEMWRRCLIMDDATDPYDAIIAELSEYFHMPVEQVRHYCLHWEEISVQEWQAGDRSTPDGLLNFYQTQTSWIFDTMWYHASQYHETAPAETVNIVHGLRQLKPGHHLDFGAGPGSSSLFFHALGWQVSLADISTTFQGFAKWRLQKHDVPATFYDNSKEDFPAESFDLITAFDVMVHIPNISETLTQLHRALKPGGYLVFNIDNLPRTSTTEWHLYKDQYPILGKVRTLGFIRHSKITYFHVYQKVSRTLTETAWISIYDTLRYNQYVTTVGNMVRIAKQRISGHP